MSASSRSTRYLVERSHDFNASPAAHGKALQHVHTDARVQRIQGLPRLQVLNIQRSSPILLAQTTSSV